MLEVNSLKFEVRGLQILNGCSFSVKSGETVGIIGPNGSGKTTLFNCLSGFITPSAGKITFAGTELEGISPAARAKLGIGRVFQNFGIFREMTLSENVVTALESRSDGFSGFFPWTKSSRAFWSEALGYLEEVGLADKANHKASSLSGGQMRLLEIIRTLSFGAELFLLDEPTAGVSPKMKTEVASLISKLRDRGKTVLVIEHDLNFIQSLCSRTIVLDQGLVVLDGETEKIRNDRLLKEIYLGTA